MFLNMASFVGVHLENRTVVVTPLLRNKIFHQTVPSNYNKSPYQVFKLEQQATIYTMVTFSSGYKGA